MQYPPSFYDLIIIKQTLSCIGGEIKHHTEKSSIQSNTRSGKVALIIQYRGKCTEDYAWWLHKINAPGTYHHARHSENSIQYCLH